MAREFNKKLILEDGSEYYGVGFGANVEKVFEVVFNTSMFGYQEIVAEPSNAFQGVALTYPLIGNYGINKDDDQTSLPTIACLIVSEYNDKPSNFRSSMTLNDKLERHGIPAIEGIDTRKLTRRIRDNGTCLAIITNATTTVEEGLKKIKESAVRHDGVAIVSTKKAWRAPAQNSKFKVAAIDCGMKQNIVKLLNDYGCDVTVFPYNVSLAEIEKIKPNGVFITSGPGDPVDAKPVIELVKQIKGKLPVFGIGLGHQIIALAYGAKTYKLKFGHRGGNQPVKNLATGKVEISAQNHGYAVQADTIEKTGLTVTHLNLLDGTVEGLSNKKDKVLSVQYYPESTLGAVDSKYLFEEFIANMKK